MNYYDRFSPDVINQLKNLNDELLKEEKQTNYDSQKILKLRQQILMKGLEMSVGNYNKGYNII